MSVSKSLSSKEFKKSRYIAVVLIIGVVWYIGYKSILSMSKYVTYFLFNIANGSKLGDVVQFFIYDTLKIMLLLVAMVYVISWIRASISVEKIRDFLLGKRSIIGYFFGSLFGAVTPFCSCSSIPMFLGFTSARIPLGVTMAFLITSPMINEVAVVILWGLLGWKFTVVYVVTGMAVGMIGGFIMDKLKAERWLKNFLRNLDGAVVIAESHKMTWEERHNFATAETKDIFRRVWKWIIIGVGVAAAVHGYVPEEFITENLGAGQWWAVPMAVLMGLPLYTNITGVIPVMESLLLKGLPIGTTLAFCMSTITVSIPEILMLKQVMKWQLLALFVGLMVVMFILVGWLFNFLFPYLS